MSQIGEAFVRVRLDTTGVPADMRRVERSVASANREVSRFGRGALVGTGALRELGRAAAFASLSFIGGAGIVVGLKSTIRAAMESQVVLGQTQNAVKNAGVSWAQWGDEIQRVALEQANLAGIDDERLLPGFARLLRATGSVNRAFQLNALATDVARGANIEYERALQIVTRASLGQARGLAQIGVRAKEGASGMEIIDAITRKYTGSAAKFAETAAGAQARFSVALGNTQEVIGEALLPSLTEYLTKAADWLNNTENQERIQRDTKTAVDFTTSAIEGLAGALGDAKDAGDGFLDFIDKLAPGGNNYSLQDLAKDFRDVQKSAKNFGFPEPDQMGRFGFSITGGIGGGNFPETPTGRGLFADIGFGAREGGTGGVAAEAARARLGTRNEMTLTELARAQARGDRAAIESAVRTRQQFVRDTIAFANRLIAQGRGDTGKLYNTLQSFYGEQESLDSILQGFRDADERARQDRIDDLAEDKRQADEDAAEWRAQNRQYHEAVAAMLRQGREFHERFREQVRQEAEDARARGEQRFETSVLGVENAITAAGLIGNEDRALAAERKARRALIAIYQSRVDTLVRQKAGLNAIVRAKSDVLTAKKALRDLNKKERTSDRGGFSLQELFAEAGEQFDLYGSNVGGGPLSAQDARGAFAGTVKSHQTTVVQNFYGEKGAGQALSDAARVAKNMKAG